LGVETQRQWSDLAILRTTPTLLGLFSLVTLFACQLLQGQALPVRQAAWYTKTLPTFADTLALVRQHLWPVSFSYLSPPRPGMVEISRALFTRLTDTLAFAASSRPTSIKPNLCLIAAVQAGMLRCLHLLTAA